MTITGYSEQSHHQDKHAHLGDEHGHLGDEHYHHQDKHAHHQDEHDHHQDEHDHQHRNLQQTDPIDQDAAGRRGGRFQKRHQANHIS